MTDALSSARAFHVEASFAVSEAEQARDAEAQRAVTAVLEGGTPDPRSLPKLDQAVASARARQALAEAALAAASSRSVNEAIEREKTSLMTTIADRERAFAEHLAVIKKAIFNATHAAAEMEAAAYAVSEARDRLRDIGSETDNLVLWSWRPSTNPTAWAELVRVEIDRFRTHSTSGQDPDAQVNLTIPLFRSLGRP